MTLITLPQAGPVRRRPGEMNATEAAYAEHLTRARAAGTVREFQHEAVTLRLGKDCRFTPDFVVVRGDGRVEFHDTKGTKWSRTARGRISKPFIREDARVKLAAAAARYPWWRFCVVWQVRPGEWERKEL